MPSNLSNYDGTTSISYTLGDVNGVTLWHSVTDPSLTETINPGDIWLNNTSETVLVRNQANTNWIVPKAGNLSFDTNTISNDVPNNPIILRPSGTGTVSVAGTLNYETLLSNDDDVPNKKYVDDSINNMTYPVFVINVAKNGDDILGSGTIYKPFLTVDRALRYVDIIKADLSASYGCNTSGGTSAVNDANFMIVVHPGFYEEVNPLPSKQNTFIKAFDPGLCCISGVNTGQDLFSMPNDVNIFGVSDVSLSGTTQHVFVLNNANAKAYLKNVRIACAQGVRVVSGELNIDDVRDPQTNISALITNEGGTVNSNTISFSTMNVITKVVSSFNNANTVISNFNVSGQDIDTVLESNDTSVINVSNGSIKNVKNGAKLNNSSTINLSSVFIDETSQTDIMVTNADAKINVFGGQVDLHKVITPPGYNNEKMFFFDDSEDDGRFAVLGKINVGQGSKGYTSNFGRGEAYTTGLKVIISDNDVSPTTEGSNLIDVSNNIINQTNTVSFKDVTSGHTIIVGSELTDNDTLDKVKFWGIQTLLDQGATLLAEDSFAFEFWNGTEWEEQGVFCFNDKENYRYANKVFLRSDNVENNVFGIDDAYNWQKKNILGNELHWCRIRIKNALSQLPVFKDIKIIPSSTRINDLGKTTFFGNARYKDSLFSAGNVFGESGGITNGDVDLGASNWLHRIKGSTLNHINDGLYTQFIIPSGTDTSMPLDINLYIHPDQSGASTNVDVRVSVLPIQVAGNKVASDLDDKIPVQRTLVNTNDFEDFVKQEHVISVDSVHNKKLQVANVLGFDISDLYEGDFLAIKIELVDDSDLDKNVQVWGIEVLGTKWTFGVRS